MEFVMAVLGVLFLVGLLVFTALLFRRSARLRDVRGAGWDDSAGSSED